MWRLVIKIAVVVLAFGVGLGGGLLYGNSQVKKERAAAQDAIGKIDHRMALLQKKYLETKNQSVQFQRAQMKAEGEKNSLLAEVDLLREENGQLKTENDRLIQSLQNNAAGANARFAEIQERYERLKEASLELRNKCNQYISDLQDKNREISGNLETMKTAVKVEKIRVGRSDRCEAKNAELTSIVNELLSEYEEKGVITSILQMEPLTQIQKVEIEHLLQEYRDRVRKSQVRTADKSQ